MVIGTRIINFMCLPPWHTSLPTPGAWSRVETPVGGKAYLADLDINAAFYRIMNPAGMED